MTKLLAVLLISAVLLFSASIANTNAQIVLTPKDNEAKQKIIGNLSDAVDHKYDRYSLLQGKVKGDNTTFTIYNVTGNTTIPPIVCGDGTHEEDGSCIPDVPPVTCGPNEVEENETGTCDCKEGFHTDAGSCVPNQPPIDNQTTPQECPIGTHDEGNQCVPDVVVPPVVNERGETTVNTAGDFSGTAVITEMQSSEADENVALGDLLYKSTLDPFIQVWPKTDENHCTPGNHDQEEDGNSNIAKQSSEYCGDIWHKKIAGGTTVLIGANTNGDLSSEGNTAQDLVTDASFMTSVKNVVLFTHKPCHINPGAHHPVEGNVKAFCDALGSKIPAGVKFYNIAGHEHNAQQNDNGLWFIAGTGGKGKYNCGSTEGGWSFCNDSDDGYLQLKIDNDSGDIQAKFIKASGGVMS